ncbi:MAG: GTP-binding protein TypA [Candidatus Portnoybacteria bacterium RIFCSPLOWO2_02_FULL_39_11]|uniref:50S ribosomal subunit assembly factor BipA n=1 Tax=Candidatus Portnoybacteria bacterium RIFCSPLOWO2_02_FULL_39_11 TaxID=1802001 RepID=A0A1G2FSE9_9BACT|nr:MAG: GTP-binding protein TypA [Candidatus Portnoybacteria bacterium RIFCSPLOWO2_02_FULL_39_11]
MEIRNIAIIAHVDHGKTRLTDALLQQTGMAAAGVSMDSNDLEQERGITIYSKNASIFYKDTKINIVDTPGHADFGSEVERILRSIDSVLLVVDAQEGPMPQTKFVLKKSLESGLKPIVVINKIDKPAARPEWVQEAVLELFMDLGASEEQLNFVTVFTNAKQGIAKIKLTDESNNLAPLLETILREAPAASSPESAVKPLRFQPFNLAYDNFLGRLAIGRIYEGSIKPDMSVQVKKPTGETQSGKITKIFTFRGLERIETSEAMAGDIAMVAGLPDIFIGETICQSDAQEALPAISIDEPTISLNFLVNNSPFAGREGKFVTTRQIRERIERELEVNVGLKVDFSANDYFKVYGRGELHIAILLENMRREGYELQVSQPQVIIKEEGGKKLEPFEELTIDVSSDMVGTVMDKLSRRKGSVLEMKPEQSHMRLIFEIPTRGFLGYRSEFVIDTRGEGILSSRVIGFKPYVGEMARRSVGSMISMIAGKALGFSLYNLQERGALYIGAGTEVYEGMVIGNTSKGEDLNVNPIKGKQLTNMRSKSTDEAINLTPPLDLTLERGLEIMNADEYLEVTPKSIRLRKQLLTAIDRTRAGRK